MIQYLASLGVDPEDVKQPPLHEAAYEGDIFMVCSLLANGVEPDEPEQCEAAWANLLKHGALAAPGRRGDRRVLRRVLVGRFRRFDF